MKHIHEHPARIVTVLLAAVTLGFLLLMHAHSSSESTCASEAGVTSIIKLI